jgi:hypothetical protein
MDQTISIPVNHSKMPATKVGEHCMTRLIHKAKGGGVNQYEVHSAFKVRPTVAKTAKKNNPIAALKAKQTGAEMGEY